MRFVKLDATRSTNDFLKELSAAEPLENFTVVSAESQTQGKGQMGAVWTSEAGKNLTMSVLAKDVVADIQSVFLLNAAVATAVVDVLKRHAIPQLQIKWPNDIMAGNKKVGGILIENSFKSDGSVSSVVGLGLNVNQTNFNGLPQASSLSLATGRMFDRDELLVQIAEAVKENAGQLEPAWERYSSLLFRKGVPTAFQLPNGERFMGIIADVTLEGKLQVQLEDGSLVVFGIKEIQMLY
ncbi:biotin--[acetyl-CoA-carboxylase] ligase [Flavobacterium caeni]|uniref:BirA family transcriptional regulator, biotin operon repressor / biotin-[acetyl-CoA-carboxylase] ligase n=1 Tax=Flavobacterium caeni TaxID=490189 RepID=A0A1G5CN24_9FLAO|nr:biotin--[acetyl-CoA-carboxylase] ligase [Flavobacterium caeni]SCY03796.1 BirA family transcriptional regulator, biotin operon repressor / biotin-[acetyl-CoA-carboxylase] ligase [Flavobacterium caeni]